MSIQKTLHYLGIACLALTLAPAADVHADQAKGFACPPAGQEPFEIVTCYDGQGMVKPGFPKKNPKPFKDGEDVNGDGKKDRLGSSMQDQAGNKVECWCLQKSTKTPQQFAYAFVTPDGKRHWFGGCYFDNAYNTLQCDGDVVTEGAERGQIKEYRSVWQVNIDLGPPGATPTGTKDKHFHHYNSGPNKGKNLKALTKGMWKNIGGRWYYFTTESNACPLTDPPAQPQDLLSAIFPGFDPTNPDAVAALGDFPGVDQPGAAVLADEAGGPQWRYSLMIAPPFPAVDEDGELSTDVEITGELSIFPGDEMTIVGEGIYDAWVDGMAASPDFGGWTLAKMGPEYATFVATTSGNPDPGAVIDSFIVVSDAPAGTIRWAYMGEQIGMSYVTPGPGHLVEDETAPPMEEDPLPVDEIVPAEPGVSMNQ